MTQTNLGFTFLRQGGGAALNGLRVDTTSYLNNREISLTILSNLNTPSYEFGYKKSIY